MTMSNAYGMAKSMSKGHDNVKCLWDGTIHTKGHDNVKNIRAGELNTYDP